MAKKFVIFIDTQVDFMLPTGKLAVTGANLIINDLTAYAHDLSPETVEGVLFTFDTHHEETYPSSEEAKQFPIHCLNGSAGWQNVINYKIIDPRIPTYQLSKGVFNMWEQPDLRLLPALASANIEESSADRDQFFMRLLENGVTDVEVVGVAADFCVKWAVDGLISQGFNVHLRRKLTAGIVRDIDTVVAEDYNGQSVTISD